MSPSPADISRTGSHLIDSMGRRSVAQRFPAHLAIEYPAVFTFLLDPAIEACCRSLKTDQKHAALLTEN